MNLFNTGRFKLHSGQISNFKIDCDALLDKDIQAIAELISSKIDFSDVFGVPEGGVRLARALSKYRGNTGPILIVDDVLTTGRSVQKQFDQLKGRGKDIVGIVLFSRGECPHWVKPVFQLNSDFEDRGGILFDYRS